MRKELSMNDLVSENRVPVVSSDVFNQVALSHNRAAGGTEQEYSAYMAAETSRFAHSQPAFFRLMALSPFGKAFAEFSHYFSQKHDLVAQSSGNGEAFVPAISAQTLSDTFRCVYGSRNLLDRRIEELDLVDENQDRIASFIGDENPFYAAHTMMLSSQCSQRAATEAIIAGNIFYIALNEQMKRSH